MKRSPAAAARASAGPSEFMASLRELPSVMRQVDQACSEARADEEDAFAIRLAVEETFSNIVRHGYPPDEPGPVRIAFAIEPGRVRITIDDDAPPFDIRDAPEPHLAGSLEGRMVGGLGVHLIGEFMDEVKHEARAGGNRLVLVRRLRDPSRRQE